MRSTDEDVKALAQFYATPPGQHFNQHSVDVPTDSMKFGRQFAAQRLNQISADICEEYSELQGQAKFCYAGNKKAGINSSSQ